MHLKTFNLALRRCLLRWIRCYQVNGLLSMVVHAFDVDLALMDVTKDEKKLRMLLDLLESRKYPVILLHEELSAPSRGSSTARSSQGARQTKTEPSGSFVELLMASHQVKPIDWFWQGTIGDQHLSTFTNVIQRVQSTGNICRHCPTMVIFPALGCNRCVRKTLEVG